MNIVYAVVLGLLTAVIADKTHWGFAVLVWAVLLAIWQGPQMWTNKRDVLTFMAGVLFMVTWFGVTRGLE